MYHVCHLAYIRLCHKPSQKPSHFVLDSQDYHHSYFSVCAVYQHRKHMDILEKYEFIRRRLEQFENEYFRKLYIFALYLLFDSVYFTQRVPDKIPGRCKLAIGCSNHVLNSPRSGRFFQRVESIYTIISYNIYYHDGQDQIVFAKRRTNHRSNKSLCQFPAQNHREQSPHCRRRRRFCGRRFVLLLFLFRTRIEKRLV